LIVLVVRHGYGLAVMFLSQLGKPLVAQLACCHLDADTPLLRISLRIKVLDKYIPFLSPFASRLSPPCLSPFAFRLSPIAHCQSPIANRHTSHIRLVSVTLLTAQVKVAVCHNALVSSALQYVPQRHAVRTATHAYQHTVAALQQTMVTDIFLNPAKHFLHFSLQN
jgi:hypothetical protein